MTPIRIFPLLTLPLLAGCAGSLPITKTWAPLGALPGQETSTLLADDTRPNNVYAGLENGEFYRSTDQGRSWARVAAPAQGARINRLLQSPDTGATMYAATAAGLFASENRGTSWSNLGSARTCYLALAIDPWNPRAMYAGTRGHGLSLSTDAGRTWTSPPDTAIRGISTADVYDIRVDVTRPDVIYAASSLGLLKSTDRGRSWKIVTEGYTTLSPAVTHLLISGRSGSTLVYATDAGGIYRTTNGGSSWSTVRFGLEVDRILSLLPDPTAPELLYAATRYGVLTSSDFGESWTSLRSPLPSFTCSIAAPSKGRIPLLYAYGGGVGVQRSTDGGQSWKSADAGLGSATVTLVAEERRTHQVYAATAGTLLAFDETLGTWRPAGNGLLGSPVRSIAFDQDSLGTLYAGTSAGIFKSTDAGASWQRIAQKLFATPGFLDAHPWLRTRMFASGEPGLFVSTDKGGNWKQARPIGATFNVSSITYTPTDAGMLLAATSNSSVIASTDGGMSWFGARVGLGDSGIVAVTRDDVDPGLCYAWGRTGEGFRSTNNGKEWNRFLPPWKKSDSVQIVFDHDLPSSVIALVNRSAVYFSPSGGGTWFRLLDARLPSGITALSWNGTEGILLAGVRDHGIYRVELKGRIEAATGG